MATIQAIAAERARLQTRLLGAIRQLAQQDEDADGPIATLIAQLDGLKVNVRQPETTMLNERRLMVEILELIVAGRTTPEAPDEADPTADAPPLPEGDTAPAPVSDPSPDGTFAPDTAPQTAPDGPIAPDGTTPFAVRDDGPTPAAAPKASASRKAGTPKKDGAA